MVQWSNTTTADVLISFQQNPGTADGVEIINAGEGWSEGKHGPVTPQRKGYYGLRMQPDQHQVMNLFGTRYKVSRIARNAITPAIGNADFQIVSRDGIWYQPVESNYKVQHCLQMLGYYRGAIDGILERQTEEALLAFQADNKLTVSGLRWLRADNANDAILDANAVKKIVSVVNDKNKISKQSGGAVYLIRKSLIRFTRAPTADPNVHVGPAVLGAPDVDDRGFGRAEANGLKCRGPVTSYSFNPADSADNTFRVKVIRDGISNDADLVAESEDPNYVSIRNVNGILDKHHYMNLEMTAGNPGRKSRKVRVYIKWKKNDNEEYIIATLRVIILPIKILDVQPWLVGIKNYDGPPNDKLPQLSYPNLFRIFNRANGIWRPYGIKFRMRELKNFHVKLKVNDIVSKLNRDGHLDSDNGRIWTESKLIFRNWDQGRGADPANSAPKDAINLYIVKDIEGAFGSTISRFRTDRHGKTGIILKNRQEGPQRTGDTLAHELGHFLGLANNYGNPKYTHVEDDPDAPTDAIQNTHKRRDTWRIRRLMLGTRPDRLTSHGWAYLVGYDGHADSPLFNGKMLSLRNLDGDKTDNECLNAYKRSRETKVYYS